MAKKFSWFFIRKKILLILLNFLIKFKRYLNELFLNIQMSLCCGASKSCSMIGLSPKDFDLFEWKSYCEKGGHAAEGGVAAPF